MEGAEGEGWVIERVEEKDSEEEGRVKEGRRESAGRVRSRREIEGQV